MAKLKVLMASSEVVPFAKTGGLADVAGSLPKALAKQDIDIRVVMPKYATIPEKFSSRMRYRGFTFTDMHWKRQYIGVFELTEDGVSYYFIDNESYFRRDALYGYGDENEQFIFFSKAVLAMLTVIDFTPDVFHLNDWQTAAIPLLLDAGWRSDPHAARAGTVYTIHNLKYQGIFPKRTLSDYLNIGWEYFRPDRVEYHDCVNLMKAGLVFSDIITTVSPTYAREIQTDFFGEGLNDILCRRHQDVFGILNGIDMETNDPASDKRLYAPFSPEQPGGKAENKRRLQEDLGLPQRPDVPVIGVISRLVDQKGFDLIERVLGDILRMDMQLVILGTGEWRYEEMFRKAQNYHPDKVSAHIRYDGTLAQRIYAASDIFLMPSLFEPCGLSQLFSMRYGTLPLVRETGGLNDTVQAFNETTGEGNGFTFSNYNAHDMLYTLERAVRIFHEDKAAWQMLMKRAMTGDYSWDASATRYIELYRYAAGIR